MYAVVLVHSTDGETDAPTVIATAILPEGLSGDVIDGRGIYRELEDAEHAFAIMERDFAHTGAVYLIADANSIGDWVPASSDSTNQIFEIDAKLDRVYA